MRDPKTIQNHSKNAVGALIAGVPLLKLVFFTMGALVCVQNHVFFKRCLLHWVHSHSIVREKKRIFTMGAFIRIQRNTIFASGCARVCSKTCFLLWVRSFVYAQSHTVPVHLSPVHSNPAWSN